MPEPTNYPFINPVPSSRPVAEAGSFGFYREATQSVHQGIDLHAAYGQPVYATYSGTVIRVGWLNDLAGYGVEIEHAGGYISRYLHMPGGDGIMVRKGDRVTTGQQIGKVGRTGNANAPHIHFEIRYRGKPYDPVRLGVFGGENKTPEYGRRRAQASSMLMAYLDETSKAVAGGTRVTLPQLDLFGAERERQMGLPEEERDWLDPVDAEEVRSRVQALTGTEEIV